MVYVKDGVVKLDDAIRASAAGATAAEKLANAPAPDPNAPPGQPGTAAAATPEPEDE
jgi:hypothetical protein